MFQKKCPCHEIKRPSRVIGSLADFGPGIVCKISFKSTVICNYVGIETKILVVKFCFAFFPVLMMLICHKSKSAAIQQIQRSRTKKKKKGKRGYGWNRFFQ
jgi:hypothetical protein